MSHFYDVRWGDLDLIIYERTYQFASIRANFNEIILLPDPNNLGNISSALQQGGRARKRVSFQGAVTDIADYNKLMEDHMQGVIREFIGYDQIPFTSIIETLSPPIWRNTFYNYNMSLVEVE